MQINHRSEFGPQIAAVLGCGQAHERELRARAAARFAADNAQSTLILTGDGREGKPGITEAAKLRKLIGKLGVADSRLRLERQAGSTIDNAVRVRIMLAAAAPRPLYVVTSPFHIPRAMLAFRHVFGPHWQILPYPSRPAPDDAQRAQGERDLSATENFFRDITPGDLDAIKAKLGPGGKPLY